MDSASTVSRSRASVVASDSRDELRDRVRSLKLSDTTVRRRSSATFPWILTLIFASTSAYLAYKESTRSLSEMPSANGSPALTNTPSGASSDTSSESNSGTATPPAAVPTSDRIALESKGYLVPAHQILVSPKVSGMVTKLFIEEGIRVEKGQVLGELEKTDYDADLKRAKATLELYEARLDLMKAGSRIEEREQVAAELSEAERQLEQLKREYERNVALRKKDRSLVPDATFEEQSSQYEATEQKVRRLTARRDQVFSGNRAQEIRIAEAEVQQARADLDKAEWRLGNCTIRAPLSGTVLKKNAEEGNIVNPIAFNGSFSLCDLADLSDLEVDLSIQERDVNLISVRQQCEVRAEAYPNRVYQGVVDRLMPIADRAKGALPIRVKVVVPKAEEGQFLKPDMSVMVTFLNSKAGGAAQRSQEESSVRQ